MNIYKDESFEPCHWKQRVAPALSLMNISIINCGREAAGGGGAFSRLFAPHSPGLGAVRAVLPRLSCFWVDRSKNKREPRALWRPLGSV